MGQKHNKEMVKPEIKYLEQNKEKFEDKFTFNDRIQSKKSEQKSLPIVYQYKIQFQIPQQQNYKFVENDPSFLKEQGENQECVNLDQSTINLQNMQKDQGLFSQHDEQYRNLNEIMIDAFECKNKLRVVPFIIQDEQSPLVIKVLDDSKFQFNNHFPTEQEVKFYNEKQITISNLRIAGIWKYLGPYSQSLQNKQPYQLLDNSIYIGEWFEGKRDGFGYSINNDYIYEGYWRNDKYDGNGRIIYENGNVYIGCFKQGQYNGEGFLKATDQLNIIYEGEWQNGMKNGMGKEQMVDGTIFLGQFKENERHGLGKLYNLKDQYVFEGEWTKGILQEKGVLTWYDGRKFEGGWKNNMMNGQGLFIWPEGKKYVGNYVNNKRDGYGEYYYKDGKIYKGMWKDGLMNGQGVIIYPNNTHEIGIWKQGKKIDQKSKQRIQSNFKEFEQF